LKTLGPVFGIVRHPQFLTKDTLFLANMAR
jgi:hypothetical protein